MVAMMAAWGALYRRASSESGLRASSALGRGWSYVDPAVSLLYDLLDRADRVHTVHGDARRFKGHQRAAICTL